MRDLSFKQINEEISYPSVANLCVPMKTVPNTDSSFSSSKRKRDSKNKCSRKTKKLGELGAIAPNLLFND